MLYQGPGPFLEIQVPLKNNNSPPLKFQIDSAPRKYTSSKISSSFLISGKFIPC